MKCLRTARLCDVCRQDRTVIRSGEHPEFRYVGMETVESDTGQFLDGELSKTPEVPQANTFRFGPEHVLYGKLRPYLNKVALPDFEGKCSTELVPLLPKPELDRRYLAYFLRSRMTVSRISTRTAGARMPRADMDFVLSLEIPLPSLDEQQRISDLLFRAEGILRLRREAQKKATEIIPTLFIDMFGDPATNPKGWPEATLREIVEEFRYGTSQKSGDSGLPALRIPNVIADRLNPQDMKLVDVPSAEAERLRLREGDILFVRTNGNPDYVGRNAVFEGKIMEQAGFDKSACIYASYLIRARLIQTTIAPRFLQAFLASSEGRRRLRERARTSAGQYNINTEGLSQIRVPLPPLKIQEDFATRCGEVYFVIGLQRTAMAKAEAIFQATLANAFFEKDSPIASQGEKRMVAA